MILHLEGRRGLNRDKGYIMNVEKKDNKQGQVNEAGNLPRADLLSVRIPELVPPFHSPFENLTKSSIFPTVTDFASLSERVSNICGRDVLSSVSAITSSPPGSTLWGEIGKAKDTLSSLTAGHSIEDSLFGTKAMLGLIPPSKWALDTEGITALTSTKDYLNPAVSVLSTLETQTSLIAKDYGIPKITSVATQISEITGLLSTQAKSVMELIAPSTMMTDLQQLAVTTHQSFVKEGEISEWKLGMVDSASYLVDRQVDWVSQLCKTAYGTNPVTQFEEIALAKPRVNVISWLPVELDHEKQKKADIAPEEALEKSSLYRISEKGKKLINKLVDINKFCERTGREPVFKYTGGSLRAAASMVGTYCSNREDFGEIIDGLYVFFYENIEHIKLYVPDEVVRVDDIFQCIFRMKTIRADYRHDYEHGTAGKIKKKELSLGECYSHYGGKPVLVTEIDFHIAQEKMYDEFDELANHLLEVVAVAVS